MKKADVAIVLCILILILIFFLIFEREPIKNSEIQAKVYISGELYAVFSLEEEPREVVIQGEGGKNALLIEADGVRMAASDCLNQNCVHMGKISAPEDVIVCLPHKVMVKLEGGKARPAENGKDVDTVAG